jgi:hypothetical protein
MQSKFHLITREEELGILDEDVSRSKYMQVLPRSAVTGSSFGSKKAQWTFDIGQDERYFPSESFFRIKAKITDDAGNLLIRTDGIAPGMNLPAALFESGHFKIGNTVVSKIEDHLAEIDTLYNRMYKTKSYLDGFGKTVAMWNPSFYARVGQMSESGDETDNWDCTTDYGMNFNAADQIVIAVDTGIATFTLTGAPTVADVATVFKPGDEIEIDNTAGKGPIRFRVLKVTAVDTIQLDNVKTLALADAVYRFKRWRRKGRQVYDIDMIWCPSMGINKYQGSLPVGNYEITLNTLATSMYKYKAVESDITDTATKTPGTGEDFNVSIDEIYYYARTVRYPRFTGPKYFLDLDEIRCQPQSITASTSSSLTFQVSPSCNALTVAFYGASSTSADTRYPSTKFISPSRTDKLLTSLQIQYASQSKPDPSADLALTASTKDHMQRRYVESFLNIHGMTPDFNPESFADWLERGAFYHFRWEKDGGDTSTTVIVRYTFSSAFTGQMLLFEHFKRVAEVNLKDSRVTGVTVADR